MTRAQFLSEADLSLDLAASHTRWMDLRKLLNSQSLGFFIYLLERILVPVS